MPLKICLATRNAHKIQEIQTQIGSKFEIVSLNDIGCLEELAETTDTIEGNSLQKAQYVWDNYQVNCFADDSGLEVEALNGEPGVHSAYYSGTRDFDANIQFLLDKLGDNPNRKAQFKTVITLIWEGEVHQFEGIVKGEMLKEKKGVQGFGYDPIFQPLGYQITFAEMPLEQKNLISHRSRAVAKLLSFLEKL